MKIVAYSRPDGGVSVVNFAPKRLAELMADGMTEDDAITFLQIKSVPGDATQVEVIDNSVLPDRIFRNAWTKPGAGPPAVDMPKARVLHDASVQRERRVIARDLIERETMGENVTGDKAALAAVNVQAQINAAANPIALDAIWPAPLRTRPPTVGRP